MKNLSITRPNALLFDFDGVVVDSKQVHGESWAFAYKKLFGTELPILPRESYSGKSPALIAELFAGVAGQKQKGGELLNLKKTHIVNSADIPLLLPGVNEIQSFAATHNIPYGIASNASRSYVKRSVERLQIDFNICFGFEDYTHPKPHPEPYIKLATRLGIKNSDFKNTWVFEDSLVGITAAKIAGMYPVGILTQYTEEELKLSGAQLVFANLDDARLMMEKEFNF